MGMRHAMRITRHRKGSSVLVGPGLNETIADDQRKDRAPRQHCLRQLMLRRKCWASTEARTWKHAAQPWQTGRMDTTGDESVQG
mmetsp:Transcript_7404/g.26352  ORF Transcript_7404/g.26352 Transcript_7404/m.26352 type:complete len:84 (+) Transcript_7404:694-945(+)